MGCHVCAHLIGEMVYGMSCVCTLEWRDGAWGVVCIHTCMLGAALTAQVCLQYTCPTFKAGGDCSIQSSPETEAIGCVCTTMWIPRNYCYMITAKGHQWLKIPVRDGDTDWRAKGSQNQNSVLVRGPES